MVSSGIICLIITAFGLVIYAFYHDCDPISEGRITKIDQVGENYSLQDFKNYAIILLFF